MMSNHTMARHVYHPRRCLFVVQRAWTRTELRRIDP